MDRISRVSDILAALEIDSLLVYGEELAKMISNIVRLDEHFAPSPIAALRIRTIKFGHGYVQCPQRVCLSYDATAEN